MNVESSTTDAVESSTTGGMTRGARLRADGWERFVRTFTVEEIKAKLDEHSGWWRGDGPGPWSDAGTLTAYGPLRAVSDLWQAQVWAAGYAAARDFEALMLDERFDADGGDDGRAVKARGWVHPEVRAEGGCVIGSWDAVEAGRKSMAAQARCICPEEDEPASVLSTCPQHGWRCTNLPGCPVHPEASPFHTHDVDATPTHPLPPDATPVVSAPFDTPQVEITGQLDPCPTCEKPMIVVNGRIKGIVEVRRIDGKTTFRPHHKACPERDGLPVVSRG